MLRLVKSVEKRPEEATVINWTVPVYIKNGEDYYKVCFDIKRKPLPDGTLPMTESELKEFKVLFDWQGITKLKFDGIFLHAEMETRYVHSVKNVKAILWLAERFELTSNN